MFDFIYLFVAFFFLGAVIDIIWWNINYSKYEKGFEFHEHYHIGLEIAILAFLFNMPYLLGLTIAFLIAEWFQDHPFAIKSNHLKESSIVGVGLTAFYLVALLVWG